MFSGQGSQYYQMGHELYHNNKVFNYWMNCCSDICEPLINVSLVETIYRKRPDKFEPFDRTVYTHPAIFSFEYSLSQVLLSMGIRPDYLLGYSIGEYIASAVAEVLDLEEAIKLILKNAELINTLTPISGMMAILASHTIVKQDAERFSDTTIAGINYDNHFVITGDLIKLEETKSFLDEVGISSQILPISHGFHSHRMDLIEDEFKQYLSCISFRKMKVPIISALQMGLLEQNEITPDYYFQIARQPINFQETIESWEREEAFTYIDVGPSGTLANFVKQIIKGDSGSKAVITIDMFGKDLRNIKRLQEILGFPLR